MYNLNSDDTIFNEYHSLDEPCISIQIIKNAYEYIYFLHLKNRGTKSREKCFI